MMHKILANVSKKARLKWCMFQRRYSSNKGASFLGEARIFSQFTCFAKPVMPNGGSTSEYVKFSTHLPMHGSRGVVYLPTVLTSVLNMPYG
jgi:hypothetical protein